MSKYCRRISEYAIKSMLYEVAASPKPGLVDRNNPGAHDDMDIFTFMDSIAVLSGYYYDCAKEGLNFEGGDYTRLMEALRPLGIEAEKDMFRATKGVNTHKGMIFSLGILAAAAASIYRENKQERINHKKLARRVEEITEGICKELEDCLDKPEEDLTYGEYLYKNYNMKGIRGEAESGFETVTDFALVTFKNQLKENRGEMNEILVQTLLILMAETEDSNVLGRHDVDTLYYVQEKSKQALDLGGIFTQEGLDYIKEMDRDFIDRNISSGGAADLLSVTLMFYLIEEGDIRI